MEGVSSLGVTPGFQEFSLTPGETYSGSITVVNSSLDTETPVNFLAFTAPFSVSGEDYTISFEEENDFTQLSKWITIEKPSGSAFDQELIEIPFTITVPEDALGGGQYAAIIVRAATEENTSEGNKIGFNRQVASIIYASVAGETTVSGEIVENNIPNFFFSSPISTSSLVKNDGNVHAESTYTMKIFPLFSDEELYSTEETPKANIIIPKTTLLTSSSWDETPQLGIFRVVQTVSAFGHTSTNERTVFVCPLWFLTLWIIFIIAGVVWVFSNSRARKKAAHRAKKYNIPQISR